MSVKISWIIYLIFGFISSEYQLLYISENKDKKFNFHYHNEVKIKFSKSYKYRMIIEVEYRERYHITKWDKGEWPSVVFLFFSLKGNEYLMLWEKFYQEYWSKDPIKEWRIFFRYFFCITIEYIVVP